MPQAIFAYHLGMDAEQYAFFRISKLLITEPYFRRLSTDAKLLYGLMLDRMSLSMKNGWMDDDGHVYIYFTLKEACERLCCKTDKAVKLFAELDSAKGVGLIRRVKQGLGRPAKIYVLRFNLPKIGRRSLVQPRSLRAVLIRFPGSFLSMVSPPIVCYQHLFCMLIAYILVDAKNSGC